MPGDSRGNDAIWTDQALFGYLPGIASAINYCIGIFPGSENPVAPVEGTDLSSYIVVDVAKNLVSPVHCDCSSIGYEDDRYIS